MQNFLFPRVSMSISYKNIVPKREGIQKNIICLKNHNSLFHDDQESILSEQAQDNHFQSVISDFINGNLERSCDLFQFSSDSNFTSYCEFLLNDEFINSLISTLNFCFLNRENRTVQKALIYLMRFTHNLLLYSSIIESCSPYNEIILNIMLHHLQLYDHSFDEIFQVLSCYTKSIEAVHILMNTDLISTLNILLENSRFPECVFSSFGLLAKMFKVLKQEDYPSFENIIMLCLQHFIDTPYPLLKSTIKIISFVISNEKFFQLINSTNFFDVLVNLEITYHQKNAKYAFVIFYHAFVYKSNKLNMESIFISCTNKLTDYVYYHNKSQWPSMGTFLRAAIKDDSDLFLNSKLLHCMMNEYESMQVIEKYETVSCISVFILSNTEESNIRFIIEHGGFDLITDIVSHSPSDYGCYMIEALIKIIRLNLIPFDITISHLIDKLLENQSNEIITYSPDIIDKLNDLLYDYEGNE
ncbi:hypothetical protein TRFO_29011 [Tritrichomonas foetus]|uniref:Uncharacterized protein n=1 Tax=Tritrichomonas foetus TaxID=1144522 RepID=A0A1J4K1F9_9EUKA|nr:hypothetical protein TRFO_29011 [Tritrichomonas foetus]|eukprot:OHT03580.1 hypothetical protein TRFO_29011 [Tritrichomonas foetus]